jgi:hypothetical protein
MANSEERKDRVIDLYYNQRKTTRDIASIERMSIRDISSILKEEESRQQKYKHQQQQQETSSKAYELFSKGKDSLEVAIALNLRAPEVTVMCKEYWKLARLKELHSAYEELGDNGLRCFLELYKTAKKEGMTVEKVINALAIAGEELPYIEERRELLNEDVNALESKKQMLQNDLNILNDRIPSSKELLKSYDMSCNRKRQESENLNNEISRLKALVNQFKSCDEGYFMIKRIVEESVTSVLVDDKKLLQLAITSIIESLRRYPNTYKHPLFYDISSSSSSSTTIPIQQSLPLHIEDYKNIILNEANRLYDYLMKYFQNKIMDNDIFKMISLSSLPFNSAGQSNQMDIYKIEEEPESYHDDNYDNDE